jgi:hypothetical protein
MRKEREKTRKKCRRAAAYVYHLICTCKVRVMRQVAAITHGTSSRNVKVGVLKSGVLQSVCMTDVLSVCMTDVLSPLFRLLIK